MNQTAQYDLAGRVIGCAMAVHRELGAGFCESVYHKALIHELNLKNISHETEKKIKVRYKKAIVGDFSADLFVENQLIVELKACQSISSAHEVQLVNYLTATGTDEGLLLNFGASSLEFKKKYRVYRSKAKNPPRLQGEPRS